MRGDIGAVLIIQPSWFSLTKFVTETNCPYVFGHLGQGTFKTFQSISLLKLAFIQTMQRCLILANHATCLLMNTYQCVFRSDSLQNNNSNTMKIYNFGRTFLLQFSPEYSCIHFISYN